MDIHRDEFLLTMIRMNVAEAFSMMFQRFRAYSFSILRNQLSYVMPILSREDIENSISLVFEKTTRAYQSSNGYFYTFWRESFLNQINNLFRSCQCGEKGFYSSAISLDKPVFNEIMSSSDKTFHDFVSIRRLPTNEINTKEALNLISEDNSGLDLLQRKILAFIYLGFDTNEISNQLHLSTKTIRKIAKSLDSFYVSMLKS